MDYANFKSPSEPWDPFSDEELLLLATGLAELRCQGQVDHIQEPVHTELTRCLTRQLHIRQYRRSKVAS